MKRLWVILLFLLLGAIVNVAVAWGIALMQSFEDTSNYDMVDGISWSEDETWELDRWGAFGTHYYYSRRTKVHRDDEELLAFKEVFGGGTIDNVKPNWGLMDVPTNLYQTLSGPPEFAQEIRWFVARGWPMRSLWGQKQLTIVVDTGNTDFEPRGFIDAPILSIVPCGPRRLPLYPIWPGFSINTFFYASLLWLLIPGPFVLRRFIRNKRGLCLKCAYDLQGTEHEACPECGAEVATHLEL